jgi:hypothetical protein
MADLVITAANVLQASGNVEVGVAAGTLTAGQSIYKSATTGQWNTAQCDGTADEAGFTAFGIAAHASSAGQPIVVIKDGTFNPGATVVVGTQYVISAATGKIAPSTDLVSTNKITILGRATTSALIDMGKREYTGLAVP